MQIENTKDITFPSFHLKMILTTFANVFTNHSNGTMKNEQWQQYTENSENSENSENMQDERLIR